MRVPYMRTSLNYIRELRLLRELKEKKWIFSSNRIDMILNEWEDWKTHYLPIDLKGKTVLDIGAGEGETAKLFIEAGASKVVCIEPDKNRYLKLFENSHAHKEIEVLPYCFQPHHLWLPHDFLKMDIEGYEQTLLDNNIVLSQPSVIEVHGLQLAERFEAKGYTLAKHVAVDWWTSYAYWKCKPSAKNLSLKYQKEETKP